MKKVLATAVLGMFLATGALAADPAKKAEEVKKPAATAVVPATPKEMPKVEKPAVPAKKEEAKKDEKKPADKKPADKKAEK